MRITKVTQPDQQADYEFTRSAARLFRGLGLLWPWNAMVLWNTRRKIFRAIRRERPSENLKQEIQAQIDKVVVMAKLNVEIPRVVLAQWSIIVFFAGSILGFLPLDLNIKGLGLLCCIIGLGLGSLVYFRAGHIRPYDGDKLRRWLKKSSGAWQYQVPIERVEGHVGAPDNDLGRRTISFSLWDIDRQEFSYAKIDHLHIGYAESLNDDWAIASVVEDLRNRLPTGRWPIRVSVTPGLELSANSLHLLGLDEK